MAISAQGQKNTFRETWNNQRLELDLENTVLRSHWKTNINRIDLASETQVFPISIWVRFVIQFEMMF